MSSDEEDMNAGSSLSSCSSGVASSSFSEAARRAEAIERAKIARDLDICATAPQVENHKSKYWRCPYFYKPFKSSPKQGRSNCMECMQFYAGGSSQASDHHKDKSYHHKYIYHHKDNSSTWGRRDVT